MFSARRARAGSRRSAALAALSALAVAGCGIFGDGAVAEPPGAGVIGPERITCDDVELAQHAGRPTNPVELSGIPTDFGPLPGFEVLDVETGETFVMPVEGVAGQPGGFFVVPILPANPVEGGPVELTLFDGEGAECAPFDFLIEELPEAPGAFAAMVEEVERLEAATKRLFGPWLPAAAPDGAPDLDLPLDLVADQLSGADNPNSVQQVLEGTAEVSEHVTAETERLMDGIVAESGAVEEIRQVTDEIVELSDPPPTPERPGDGVTDPPPAGGGGEGPGGLCARLGSGMSAETLSFLMNGQGKVESFRDKTDLVLTGVGFLNAAVGVASLIPSAGIPNPITVGTGVVGVTLSAYDLLADMAEHVLPRELSALDFDYERAWYLEDDEDLSGLWENVTVMATNSDWNVDGRVLQIVLKRASGGVSQAFFKRHTADAVVHRASDFLHKTFLSGAGQAALAHRADGAGFFTVPACEIGPVDISDPQFHRASFTPEGLPAVIDQDASFEIVSTGSGHLTVRAEPQRFNGSQAWKEVPVEAAPIEITIDPPAAEGDPGFVATFTVAVENANDPGIQVTIDPPGGHTVTYEQIGSNLFEITVQTSSQREDFPALMRVESTSTTGLRARPDAPPRFATAPIRTQGDVTITPWATCVEPGETFQFEAAVGFANQLVHWDATGGAIDADGRFTAPDEPGQYVVRATADADATRSATSKVTVAETCQCWAAFELPARSVYETSDGGHISFGDGFSAEMLANLVFDMANGGKVTTSFFYGVPPPIEPDWPAGPPNFPELGPKPGQTGRFLVDVTEGGFEPTGHLPAMLGAHMSAEPVGGNRFNIVTPDNPPVGPLSGVTGFQHQAWVTVEEFDAPSDSEVWLKGSLSGTVLVEETAHVWLAEPVRMQFQGRFEQGAAEEMFPGIGGTLFDAWLCARD